MFDYWRITNPIMLGYRDVLWQWVYENLSEYCVYSNSIGNLKGEVPCVNPYIHHMPPWFLGGVYVFLMAN